MDCDVYFSCFPYIHTMFCNCVYVLIDLHPIKDILPLTRTFFNKMFEFMLDYK